MNDFPFDDERALSELSAVLPSYISSRRWYRAKARTIERLTIQDLISVAAAGAFILVVRIEYGGEGSDEYFVPVAVAQPGAAATLDETICSLHGPDGREGVLYGVLSNVKFRQALLDLILCGDVFEGRKGNLVGRRTSALDAVCRDGTPQFESFVSRAEQSNTSIIYGDRYILKLFRKLEQGTNPDIEIGRFLTERGFKNTPAVFGQIEYKPENGEAYTAGILQQFVQNQGDAWSYTLKSLERFFDRAAAGAQDALGDYAGSAALLGKRTAQMHAAFEDDHAGPDFSPEPFTPQDAQKLYQDLLSQADIAFETLRRKQAILTGPAAEAAREVLRLEPEVIRRFDALREFPIGAVRIRHHGDFHLGQVLYTGSDFMIIDFEGEPARPLSERRRKALAMRDVAGMLRSFQYAAYSKAEQRLESWAAFWTASVSAIYLTAYFAEGRGLRCVPSGAGEQKLLLDAFLLQKALYEVAYELNNRPDWVHIPLRGILSLMSKSRQQAVVDYMPAFTRALTENDLYLFREGTHVKLADVLGAHAAPGGGTHFAVWAPNARSVSVVGSFNEWRTEADSLSQAGAGIWTGHVAGASPGMLYRYHIESPQAYRADKADPFAFLNETPPKTASIICDLSYEWADQDWMERRSNRNSMDAPISIYEVHLGSWRRVAEQENRSLTYRELASELIPYVKEMGFTHVEFLPVMEHPFFGSWGYQVTGFFAPTSRYGTPQDLMWLIDQFHQHGIGVILDWVPSHFPQDEHGLGYFDGRHEFEAADPRRGVHPDWNSFIFDYTRGEVRSFLLSSAMFWLDKYHADALRVDAVASMLYLDFSRKEGEWIPNRYGGHENLEAIGFLRRLNEDVYRAHPDVQTIAEESTAWPMVSRPTYVGGLGFGFKWDMGWMHDTLKYMAQDPLFRKFHHHELTFRMVYAFNENFILPLSHDEVVYGKGSLIAKMPGDEWQKFANLRLLFAYMFAQPGKKLLFMGGEFGQWSEWNHDKSLDWSLLASGRHAGLRLLVGDLNHAYRREPALHWCESSPVGFEWIDVHDAEKNVLSFLRNGPGDDGAIIVVCNFSPVPRENYRIGAPRKGFWKEILNTDARQYGGSGRGNLGGVEAVPIPLHGRSYSLTIDLPPLAAVYFRHQKE